MAYISLEHVVKRYKMGEVTITAVDDITFDIEKGSLSSSWVPRARAKPRC